MRSPHSIRLSAGELHAEIHPDIGGSLGGFWSEGRDGRIDWMRRAEPDTADARDMACYPLVPFSNRIRDGKFRFRGRDVQLPLNFLPHPHVIHGHGWQTGWQVVEQTGRSARLKYHHATGAWPWPYLAEQCFALNAHALEITISVTNTGSEPMPAGVGLHPYFPRSPDTRISGTCAGLWQSDNEVMPTELVPADTVWPSSAPLEIDRVTLDNCFTGWRRTLDLTWPDSSRSLSMEADSPLDFLIVFTPPDESFFCAEPVSHCIDAFNLAHARDDTGMITLDPDETLTATVVFRPDLGQ